MQLSIKTELIGLLSATVDAYRAVYKTPVPYYEYFQAKSTAKLLELSVETIEHREAQLDAFISSSLSNSEPSMDEFNNIMIPYGRSGTARHTLQSLRHLLVLRALEVGAEQVIEELERYLSRDFFVARQILPISGVQIEGSVALFDGIVLEPTLGNEEEYKDRLPDYEFRLRSGGMSEFYLSPYYAQFVKEHQHPRIYGGRKAEQDAKGLLPDLWNFDPLEEACLLLSLVGPSGPISVATSVWVSEWVPHIRAPLGRLPQKVAYAPTTTLSMQQLKDFIGIHRAYINSPQRRRDRLKIALSRLNSAIRRPNRVDTAIDLGIALEALFAEGKPFDASISFTLRLRAARLLRSEQADRREIAELIKNLYRLRSAGAHDGALADNDRNNEILRSGGKLVAETITRFILHGEPNWDEVTWN